MLRNILRRTPELDKHDTSLRYTDILFGLVLRELFFRIQNWSYIDGGTRFQLLVGITLVLCSWIGYRRSLHRSRYQVKFFNLPLFKFLADQWMLILYFRVAVLTPRPDVTPRIAYSPDELARHTAWLLAFVFFLYAIWDLLGIWMAKAKGKNDKPLYPFVPKEGEGTGQPESPNVSGLIITVSCFLILSLVWYFGERLTVFHLYIVMTLVLVVYRWLQEIKTETKA
jgi:hypothetical protein